MTARRTNQPDGPVSVRPTLDEIVAMVAAGTQVGRSEIMGRDRTQRVADARHLAMYLASTMTRASYAAIGSRIGGRDHSTVIHAVRRIRAEVAADQALADRAQSYQQRLREVAAKRYAAGAGEGTSP